MDGGLTVSGCCPCRLMVLVLLLVVVLTGACGGGAGVLCGGCDRTDDVTNVVLALLLVECMKLYEEVI